MRHATLHDLNIRWHYWLIPSAFGIAAIVAFIATNSEPESRLTLMACGTLFFAISLLGFLWPPLRIHEKQGVRFTSMRLAKSQLQGLLIPISQVRIYLLLLGGSVFAIFGLLTGIFADTLEYRVKGALAFFCYAGFAVLWVRGMSKHQKGILLSEQGIVWQEILLVPCFIPWGFISEARAYSHRERYGTSPTLGLLIQNLDGLDLSRRTRSKLTENFRRFGWHFYCHAETLLVPLGVVEKTVVFFLRHAEARPELVNGAALDRIEAFGTADDFVLQR